MKTAVQRMLKVKIEYRLKYFIFALLDSDSSGGIDSSEMKRLVEMWGRKSDIENCKAHIAYYDTNKNGRLEFEEFYTIWGTWLPEEYRLDPLLD